MTKTHSESISKEINFEEWITGCVDPVIKHVESLIDDSVLDDNQKAVLAYWRAFAQNSINLSRVMYILPHHFTQVMMTFRILQETSADIYYLKGNSSNISNLVKTSDEIARMTTNDDFSLRKMSKIIDETDIRGASAKKDTTQLRIESASKYLESTLGKGLTTDLTDINKLLNGYAHFNPAGIYLQKRLTDSGYIDIYMRIFHYYPAWLYLVLVSLSELLNLKELDVSTSEKLSMDLLRRIEESGNWQIVGFESGNQKLSRTTRK